MGSINNSGFHRGSVYRMTIVLSWTVLDIFRLLFNLERAQIKQFISSNSRGATLSVQEEIS